MTLLLIMASLFIVIFSYGWDIFIYLPELISAPVGYSLAAIGTPGLALMFILGVNLSHAILSQPSGSTSDSLCQKGFTLSVGLLLAFMAGLFDAALGFALVSESATWAWIFALNNFISKSLFLNSPYTFKLANSLYEGILQAGDAVYRLFYPYEDPSPTSKQICKEVIKHAEKLPGQNLLFKNGGEWENFIDNPASRPVTPSL
jgi:hypothetical protein